MTPCSPKHVRKAIICFDSKKSAVKAKPDLPSQLPSFGTVFCGKNRPAPDVSAVLLYLRPQESTPRGIYRLAFPNLILLRQCFSCRPPFACCSVTVAAAAAVCCDGSFLHGVRFRRRRCGRFYTMSGRRCGTCTRWGWYTWTSSRPTFSSATKVCRTAVH